MRTLSALLVSASVVATASAEPDPLYRALTPKISGTPLAEVPAQPFALSGVAKRPYFDHFNWQNFIALMWPSKVGSHGVPFRPSDPKVFGQYDEQMQPVWLGWKSAFELFPQDGSKPPKWEERPNTAVCKNSEFAGKRALISGSKFTTVADELDQAFGGPLPDQTGLFTRYEVRMNQVEYDFIRNQGYYNQAQWPSDGITLPAGNGVDQVGVIEVKAAWRDLRRVPSQFHSRFFSLDNAVVSVPGSCSDQANQMIRCDCEQTKVGLVGFHIAQKTPDFPQWVWATFEQVDNLGEDPTTPAQMQPSYYDPTLYQRQASVRRANPAAHPGSSRVPDANDFNPEPINVVRLSQIPDTPKPAAGQPDYSTTGLNQQYRQALAGTVWQHYQLIGSQWPQLPSASAKTPSDDDFGCEDGTSVQAGGMPFPECQLANITMETYHQYDSCMNCHQGAQRAGADFSWILATRAFQQPNVK
ncbi:hypothetical protein [uncultured Ferrimonas sp.]|uniref:hypothetical protein n=1 Tax=uncultured Ferrimonas sp. TaxID=432640 RepID=UPI0026082F42|nr:hypothetical protein [uncultured Ferrimonas sp.]